MPWSRFLRRITVVLGGATCLAGASSSLAQQIPQLDLPRIELRAGMFRIDAQVASRPIERQIGLMRRPSMPPFEGMLFVFERPGVQCFWMKDTTLPLSAAFLADDGTIVNLAELQPLDETSHCSRVPVRFVLEMNQGWFAGKGIREGSRIAGPVFKNK